MTKDKWFNIRTNPDERAMIEALAERHGESMTSAILLAVLFAYEWEDVFDRWLEKFSSLEKLGE